MGAEDTGVSMDNLRICDSMVKIPQFGTIGSLNVSVEVLIASAFTVTLPLEGITIVRAIREAVPVPIITRISTIRTNLTRNVRIGIKTGITIGTNGLTRIARIAANVRVTGGA